MTEISQQAIDRLRLSTTATIATVLRQKGIRSASLSGPRPLTPGQPRIVGPAFTVRFAPSREDLTTAQSLRGPNSFFAAIEKMPTGCVVVADGMGRLDAGIAGDIGCARMQARGVAGFVTDAAVRDSAALRAMDWAVWAGGVAAPPSPHSFHCADIQVLIGCGGVAVAPGDLIVADDDGALVVPAAMAEEIAELAYEKEQLEDWILGRIRQGEPIEGLYPPSEAAVARFKAETSAASSKKP